MKKMYLTELYKKLKKESGQSSVLFALTAIILLSTASLVIDYGRPALVARRLQNAADSAALAAAHCLPLSTLESDDELKNIAKEYAQKNGFPDGSNVDVTLGKLSGGKYLKVTVTVKDNVEYTVAKVMGKDNINVAKSASVEIKPISGLRNAVPISIKKDVFEDNIANGNFSMVLKYGGGHGDSGDYNATDLDGDPGGGARDYEDRLANGYDGLLEIGDIIMVESGNMSGPTRVGIAERWAGCHHSVPCTAAHFEPDCPRVMMAPIVHAVGNKKLVIDGFAPFILQSGTVGSGTDCEVYATYIPGLVIEGESDPSATNYGIYTRKIIE